MTGLVVGTESWVLKIRYENPWRINPGLTEMISTTKKGIDHLKKLRKYSQTDFMGIGDGAGRVGGLWEPSPDLRMVHEMRLTIVITATTL